MQYRVLAPSHIFFSFEILIASLAIVLPRQHRLVQRDPDPPAGDGQDGVDGSPGGRVSSHSALPHHAADCDGLLEVSLNQRRRRLL